MMNGAQAHLLFNHIPIIGLPFTFFLLLTGVLRKNNDLIQTAYAFLIAIALLTIPALRTGGPAAHSVRDVPGIERVRIHDHEEAAEGATWGAEILGAMGLIGLILIKKKGSAPKIYTLITLVFTLAVSFGFAKAGHLGGLIRHPEIESDFNAAMVQTAPSVESPAGER